MANESRLHTESNAQRDDEPRGLAAIIEKAVARNDEPVTTTDSPSATDDIAPPTADELSAVRDLLIGLPLNTLEQKIALFQKDIKHDSFEFETKYVERLQTNSAAARQELSATIKQLEKLVEARQNEVNSSEFELLEYRNRLQDSLKDIEDRISQSQRALLEQLQSATKRLQTNIEETYQDLLQQLKTNFDVLESNKVDRSALSGLMEGIAQNIGAAAQAKAATD